MTEKIANVVSVYERKIWIEDDIFGSKHVMIQHQDGQSEPFTYCSFFYDYSYTSNTTIRRAAEDMARRLGASDLIEYQTRKI